MRQPEEYGMMTWPSPAQLRLPAEFLSFDFYRTTPEDHIRATGHF